MTPWILLALAALASPPGATPLEQTLDSPDSVVGAEIMLPIQPTGFTLPGLEPLVSAEDGIHQPAGYIRRRARQSEREAEWEARAESEASLNHVKVMNLKRPRCDFYSHGRIMACGDDAEERQDVYDRIRPIVEDPPSP